MDATDDAEFTEFMLGCWPRLARLGYALTGDRGHAEDLAQTALAKAYASWSRVARAGHPEAYVRKIAVIMMIRGPRIARWAAYDASGHRLYGGQGAPS